MLNLMSGGEELKKVRVQLPLILMKPKESKKLKSKLLLECKHIECVLVFYNSIM